MFFKRILRKLWERLTGRRCHRCKYNRAGHCTHPSEGMFMRCWHIITRPGWTGKYERSPAPRVMKPRSEALKYVEVGRAAAEGMKAGLQHELTPEEKYQLQKIRDPLEVAEDMARESGLISED